MSQETEEVKPKLNLDIAYDGSHITVRVGANMKFIRIFGAAEERFGKDRGTLKFTYDGQRIGEQDTPASLGVQDGEQIDAFLEQLGGDCDYILSLW